MQTQVTRSAPGEKTNLMQAHDQWRTRPADQRFQTLDDLALSVMGRRARSRSTDIDKDKVIAEAGSDGGIVINNNISACAPTHWAFGQLAAASRINGVSAPANYLRQLPVDLAVKCLNQGFAGGDRDAHKFMTIAAPDDAPDGALNTLQAVTSTTYGRIWDADCVAAVQRIVEKTGGKFYNPKAYAHRDGQAPNGFSTADTGRTVGSGLYASDHDVFMFMIDGGSVLDAGPRAELNRGFIVWNSETGAKTFGLMTFLFNMVCGNNIIWGAQDVSTLLIRHTSGGPTRFDTEAAPMLKAYSEASAAPLMDTIRKAQDYLIPKSDADKSVLESVTAFCDKHGKFSRSEIKSAVDFAKAEEGDCRTLWQLVQGFTAYARGFDFIDTRVDLEKRAGALIDLAAATKN